MKELLSDAEYYETARIIAVRDMESDGEETMEQRRSVAVITAGTADIPVAEEAAVTAGMLGNRVDRIYDVGVAGIHRLFDKLDRIRAAADVVSAFHTCYDDHDICSPYPV